MVFPPNIFAKFNVMYINLHNSILLSGKSGITGEK